MYLPFGVFFRVILVVVSCKRCFSSSNTQICIRTTFYVFIKGINCAGKQKLMQVNLETGNVAYETGQCMPCNGTYRTATRLSIFYNGRWFIQLWFESIMVPWRHMATSLSLSNNILGNDPVPHGTKPLPKPLLIYPVTKPQLHELAMEMFFL